MKLYYGITRLSQLFEMIEDACDAMKGPNEDVEAAIQLMVATAGQETHLGHLRDPTTYRAGAGIMQVDPIGIEDIQLRGRKWIKFCKTKWDIHLDRVKHRELNEGAFLCVVAARVRYKVVPKALPRKDDIDGQWEYYKKYYNSYAGVATKDEFIRNRKRSLKLYYDWKRGA